MPPPPLPTPPAAAVQPDTAARIGSGSRVGLVLAGVGAVGRNLLALVERVFAVQLAVVAVGDSQGFVTSSEALGAPLDWHQVRAVLQHKASAGRLASLAVSGVTHAAGALLQLVEELHACRVCEHYVVVDCTSSQTTAPALVRARQLGFAVVMANKLPLSATTELYDALVLDSEGGRSSLVLYEATVGAGLPVITTLKRVVASRDRIVSVQGSFSGTLGYAMAAVNKRTAFSTALREAHTLGITESDPRDDLSGVDVARKMVILAREMGLHVELSHVQIAELVPRAFFELSVDEFLAKLPELDAGTWLDANSDNGARLAYIGTISATGELRVALEKVPRTSVFASTTSTEGAIEVRSEWFPEPIVLRGTGAGIDSTAAALTADLAQVLVVFHQSMSLRADTDTRN